ncbi:hypothetical protein OO256_25640 [Pseudomonas sp. DCB_CB]|uniref:hypothetical protein n=1 Tax=Pseudomonas TaxID=286 RepID=UPI000C2A0516|nr:MULTISPECIES: hypothetical protein [Pseudomonas]MCX2694335.1 hypothetical protein [Pseudomonas sp. DCB_BZ]MCX2859466.1 hypothetical protein [Pseudomonas sp. DCB_CB]PJX09689.1 hypothetical protein CQW32_14630 [Pseudomonas putida]
MKMKVYRDEGGIVRNIGEWDTMTETYRDESGQEITNIHNPLPGGYVESQEEVEEDEFGGLRVKE